jgi:hypothetical protein
MPHAPEAKTGLSDYVEDNVPGRYVGTSRHDQAAAGFPLGRRDGYVYEISGAPGGIDINEKLGSGVNPNAHEAEVVFDGGIP